MTGGHQQSQHTIVCCASNVHDSVLSHQMITSSGGNVSGVGMIPVTSVQGQYYPISTAAKYQENGDTFSDFVNLVCQEAQGPDESGGGQVGQGGHEMEGQGGGERDDGSPDDECRLQSLEGHHQSHHYHHGHYSPITTLPMLPPPPQAPMARPVPIIRSAGTTALEQRDQLNSSSHNASSSPSPPPSWTFFSNF